LARRVPTAAGIADIIEKNIPPEDAMQAILALEDGRIFRGRGCGARLERTGEVVFNTSITGYQEIFTDPSYAGQIVVLTNPEIGNYGTNPDDEESAKPYIEGLVVREFSPYASNYRSEQVTDEYLERHNVPVLSDIDTRSLVRHLRDKGVMRGTVSTREQDPSKLIAMAKAQPTIDGMDLARVVSTKEPYRWDKGDVEERILTVPHPATPQLSVVTTQEVVPEAPERKQVIAYDYGIKTNILRRLVSTGCDVTVVPAQTPPEDVLALKPDGVFLSNGPGDPEAVDYAQKAIRKLAGRVPVFGICLGHQLVGLALDGKTYKLKFGHHGGNHPVKHLQTGRVEITAHNHNYAVDPDSLKQSEVELTHVDLNDNTLEGLRHRSYPLFSVQYHPEASPGPHDSHYLFDDFVKMMREWRG
jgi:carbamoyl-phosphate synthase small subunit